MRWPRWTEFHHIIPMTNRVRKTIDQLGEMNPQIIVEAFFEVLMRSPETSPTAEELMEFITPDIGTRMVQ